MKLGPGQLRNLFFFKLPLFNLEFPYLRFGETNKWRSDDDDQSILIEMSSCNLQFFFRTNTTPLRDFHTPQVVFYFAYLPHHAKLRVLPKCLAVWLQHCSMIWWLVFLFVNLQRLMFSFLSLNSLWSATSFQVQRNLCWAPGNNNEVVNP